MLDNKRILAWLAGTLSLAVSTACGSPDLAAMKPTSAKPATLVVLVNQPTFVKSAQFVLPSNSSTSTFDTLSTTSKSLVQLTKKELSMGDVTSCMVVGDNLQPNLSDMNQLIKAYPKTHFQLVSGQAVSENIPNVSTVEQNAEAIAYSIGWLVGTWASATTTQPLVPQPTIGFVPGQLSMNAQKAFFAGLYTIDSAAVVVPMTPTAGVVGSTNTYPSVGAVVLGGQPSTSLTQVITGNSLPVFSLVPNLTSIHAAIRPGSFDSSEIISLFQTLLTGHWQAGDEQVIGTSSVFVDTTQMPSSVTTTWSALESSVSNQPNLWQSNFKQLPQNTLQTLRSEFGIA